MKSRADYYIDPHGYGRECVGSRTISPDMTQEAFEEECYSDAVWLHRENRAFITIEYDDGDVEVV